MPLEPWRIWPILPAMSPTPLSPPSQAYQDLKAVTERATLLRGVVLPSSSSPPIASAGTERSSLSEASPSCDVPLLASEPTLGARQEKFLAAAEPLPIAVVFLFDWVLSPGLHQSRSAIPRPLRHHQRTFPRSGALLWLKVSKPLLTVYFFKNIFHRARELAGLSPWFPHRQNSPTATKDNLALSINWIRWW